MRKAASILARVVGSLILVVSAITTGVHATQIRRIEANRARYSVLEQRIASDKSALLESGEQTSSAFPAKGQRASDAGRMDRLDRFKDQRAAELELGQHSSQAEEEAYLQILSRHSIDDLGLGIGIILMATGLAKVLLELPEGLKDSIERYQKLDMHVDEGA